MIIPLVELERLAVVSHEHILSGSCRAATISSVSSASPPDEFLLSNTSRGESAEKAIISPWSPNLGEVGQFMNCPYGDTPFDWAHDRPKPPPGSFLDLFFGRLFCRTNTDKTITKNPTRKIGFF